MEYSTVESTNPSASIPAQWWVSGHWCFVTNVLPSGCLRKDFHRKKTDRKRPYLCRHFFGTDLHPATSPSLDSTVCSLKTCAGLFFLSWFPRLFRTAPVWHSTWYYKTVLGDSKCTGENRCGTYYFPVIPILGSRGRKTGTNWRSA